LDFGPFIQSVGGAFIAKFSTNGNGLWANSLGPGIGFAVTIDDNGISYVAGTAPGQAVNSNVPTTWKISSGGGVVWERQAPGTAYDSQAQAISVDSNGNVYVTGRFHGTNTFGSGETNETALTADNATADGFLASYDSAGNLNWAKQIHSDTGAWGYGMATDTDSNTYVTGVINGTTTFGSGEPIETTLTAYHAGDLFLAKFNSDGLLLWVKQGPGSFTARGMAVTVGTLSVYLTGSFGSTITFGSGGPNATTLYGSAGPMFVAKYAGDGSFEWATQARMASMLLATLREVQPLAVEKLTRQRSPAPGMTTILWPNTPI
jgi:hypothetical protein